jgi:4-oxalocrotonate tautomerase family enzyme
MPIVTIETWPIPQERKPELMKKITKIFIEYGIPAQAVTILIHETQMDNWGTAGEQHSITYKEMKRENMKL